MPDPTQPACRLVHISNWYFHWSTLTPLVHRHSVLLRMRAAADTPTCGAGAGGSRGAVAGLSGGRWAAGGWLQAGQHDGARTASFRPATSLRRPAARTRLLPAPQGSTMMPERARPLPNILLSDLSW